MIYLAGPFFNPQQVELIEKIEDMCNKNSFDYYSPRNDGVLMKMTKDERANRKNEIFRMNCYKIERADLVLAIIDGRDIGTIWELGYAHACSRYYPYQVRGRPYVVTFTNEAYGLNVMIQESVDAHVKGLELLENFLQLFQTDRTQAFLSHRNFAEGVY